MKLANITLRPVDTEADYRAALKQAEAFLDSPEEPDPDSAVGVD
jgi:HTH-type transcriptional regulator/antitoxin HigA